MTSARRGSAVVSGAGSGIGRAIASALAARGHSLALAGRREAPLRETLAAAAAHGLVASADVRDEAAMQGFAARVVEELGVPEIVVAAAGVARIAPFAELAAGEFRASIETNLLGAANLLRAFLPAMIERGSGHLVVLSSVAARRVFAGWSAYSASKWGLLGLVETLREELAGSGLRLLSLTPGATETPLWDEVAGDWNRSRMIAPEEVAGALVWALDATGRAVVEEIRLQPPGGNL